MGQRAFQAGERGRTRQVLEPAAPGARCGRRGCAGRGSSARADSRSRHKGLSEGSGGRERPPPKEQGEPEGRARWMVTVATRSKGHLGGLGRDAPGQGARAPGSVGPPPGAGLLTSVPPTPARGLCPDVAPGIRERLIFFPSQFALFFSFSNNQSVGPSQHVNQKSPPRGAGEGVSSALLPFNVLSLRYHQPFPVDFTAARGELPQLP